MSKVVVLRQGSRRIRVESDLTVANVAAEAPARGMEGVPKGMRPTSAVDDIREGLDEVKALIVDTADTLYEAIDSLAGRPSKVTAEFGVKFAGEAGLPVITKVSAEAELKVTVEWTRGISGS